MSKNSVQDEYQCTAAYLRNEYMLSTGILYGPQSCACKKALGRVHSLSWISYVSSELPKKEKVAWLTNLMTYATYWHFFPWKGFCIKLWIYVRQSDSLAQYQITGFKECECMPAASRVHFTMKNRFSCHKFTWQSYVLLLIYQLKCS